MQKQANKHLCIEPVKYDKRRKYLPGNIEVLNDLIANNPQIVNFKPRKRLCAQVVSLSLSFCICLSLSLSSCVCVWGKCLACDL